MCLPVFSCAFFVFSSFYIFYSYFYVGICSVLLPLSVDDDDD